MSIIHWMDKAKVHAYGLLRLKPWEFEKLTIFDFLDMVNAYDEVKTNERRETAYWVANIISPHLKHPAKVDELVKPFMRKPTASQRAEEAEEFFRQFEENRKGG